MKKNIKRKRGKSKIRMVITNHIVNNKKDYLIAILLLLVGLIIGVMFINNVSENQFMEIEEYIKTLVNSIKSIENIDYTNIFKESMLSNLILIIIIWIASSTIIGIPIVYGNLIFRGFVLGYTISSIVSSLGILNGIIFGLTSLLLHNIIFIPVVLAASVSGMKLYKSIIKNREKENVKIEFFRHTIFCVIMLLLLVISSIIEVYISTNLVKFFINCIKL